MTKTFTHSLVRWRRVLLRVLLTILSVGYGALMMSLGGGLEVSSEMPYHSVQANALLDGRFSLAASIYQMDEGLAWHDGSVQQVWGLGVGFWLVPFESVSRLLGFEVFPGRIGLGVAFALLAFYCGLTSMKLAKHSRKPGAALAIFWLILLSPPLWTLARGPQLIFEETALYALVVSFIILLAMIRVCCFGCCLDFYVCCVLGAFVGFVRPTHAVYGVAGVLICLLVLTLRRRTLGHVIIGGLLFMAGLSGLAWSNVIRFGSPWEFGHSLTLTSEGMVFLTRFYSPVGELGFIAGMRELFGLLFLSPHPQGGDVFAEGIVPGQSSAIRWRGLYLSTFNPGVALMCAVTIAGVFVWLFRLRIQNVRRRPTVMLAAGLLIWVILPGIALALFYLHYPVITSRYLMDFAPAITGGLLLFWTGLAIRFPRAGVVALAGWLLFEIGTAEVIRPSQLRTPVLKGTELPAAEGKRLVDFGGEYSIGQHPQFTGIAYNGYGWDDVSGYAGPIIIVAIDDPEFLELVVGERIGNEAGSSDVLRARIGNKELSREKSINEGDQRTVRFSMPPAIRDQNGDEFVFLCFVDGYDTDDRESKRMLQSIRWR